MPTTKRFLSLGLEILGFFACYYIQFGRDERSQFNNETFPKMFFCNGSFGMCLPYAKRYFQVFFSLGLSPL